ncbi:MAG TPA: tryptophan synthase subunit alpha [Candidatus Scatavimonas merdigallinarum]|uniref:Tryptophan synthase alpha chain n=1 Tax=Candidatus Scatavimonas merdigallinarum TaxID=2840914 RepID=A0A9D1CUN8_9FIRM|nr:tryptophan synthase subunit alpha [Candidatus Scatavimonas merdigallinarum]
MSKTQAAFQNKKAFIPFITAGDPNLETTLRLIPAMARAGADLIEIGIPFSDPVAEGEVIQRADIRALQGGVTIDRIFSMVKQLRKTCDIPLAFMTYSNPVYVYGPEKFLNECVLCKMDALIVPDMPFEEKGELSPLCEKYGVDLISLIAPTSEKRILKIAKEAQGFLYCVSSMGVTGMRSKINTDIGKMTALAKSASSIPVAVGFGVSTPQQAQQMVQYADGVIVGSAIVRLCEQYGTDCIEPVCCYIKEMKAAIS